MCQAHGLEIQMDSKQEIIPQYPMQVTVRAQGVHITPRH